MINGKVYDWQDITVGLPYGVAIGIESIDYEDELERELAYGKGSKAVGYGTGNYKPSGKITISRDEFDKVIAFAKSKGVTLYKIPPFPITVSYANDGQAPKTDVLKGCMFGKMGNKASQGAKKLTVDIDLIITDQIVRDGLAAI